MAGYDGRSMIHAPIRMEFRSFKDCAVLRKDGFVHGFSGSLGTRDPSMAISG